MPENDETAKDNVAFDHDALRLEIDELKGRVAALHRRLDALEESERDSGDDSTRGRS